MYLKNANLSNDYAESTRQYYFVKPNWGLDRLDEAEGILPPPEMVEQMRYEGTIRLEIIANDIGEFYSIQELIGKKITLMEKEVKEVKPKRHVSSAIMELEI